MKHPIYNDQNDIDVMHVIKRGITPQEDKAFEGVFISNGQGRREYRAFKQRVIVKTQIEYYGCNLVQLKEEKAWNEVLSVKTIEKMNTDDLKLPFKAYTIDLKKSEWTKYDYVHVAQDDNKKIFIFELDDPKGKRSHIMNLDHNKSIKQEVDGIVSDEVIPQLIKAGGLEIGSKDFVSPLDQMRDSIYKVISISMYMSMFKRDKSRCVEVKQVNNKSKRKRIPGHTTNVIILSQPKYKITGKTHTPGEKQTGLYVVKGHWRSQPIGKRGEGQVKQIFIDSFFKGEGAKQLQKTYKV